MKLLQLWLLYLLSSEGNPSAVQLPVTQVLSIVMHSPSKWSVFFGFRKFCLLFVETSPGRCLSFTSSCR
jgi:hypothetical protein